MEHQEYLALVAEIAVALAGFTGIAGAFRFRDTSWSAVELTYLATLLRASISALFLSLLPYLLDQLFANPDIVWRTASGTLATVMGINIYRFLVSPRSKMPFFSLYVMYPSGFIVALINAIAALGMLPASKMFIIAVTFQLAVAAHNFTQLITKPLTEESS